MVDLFELEGLFIDADRIDMQKLKVKMSDGTFSPQLFNQMIKNDCTFFVVSANHLIDEF
jgi:hypothetical protein